VKTARWLERERKFLFERLEALEGSIPLRQRAISCSSKSSGTPATRFGSVLSITQENSHPCLRFICGTRNDYFRIAVKRRRDNRCLLRALEEWTASSIG